MCRVELFLRIYFYGDVYACVLADNRGESYTTLHTLHLGLILKDFPFAGV